MIDATLQDLRHAIRALRSNPGFAAVAILSLALGIGANTAIFSLIDSLILKTLPVSHPEQLLQVTMGKNQFFSNPIWEQLRDRQDIFSGIFSYSRGRFNLTAGGESRFAQGNYASGQLFDTLGLHTMLGRAFTPSDDRRGCAGIAVLSNGFWQREYAGRADVVGKTISLDNHPFEIVGVLHPGFTGVEVGYESDLMFLSVPSGSFVERQADWIIPVFRDTESSAVRSQASRLDKWMRGSKRWPVRSLMRQSHSTGNPKSRTAIEKGHWIHSSRRMDSPIFDVNISKH